MLYSCFLILYTEITMILFFYGEDNFRLKQKIKELKQKFIDASLGDTNLAVLDGKTEPYDNIVRQILAMPFLAKSRLVIIENLLKEGKPEVKEKIVEFLPKIPASSVVVFVEEGSPDKRTALYKKLNQPKTSQEFKLLEGAELNKWIKDEVRRRGGEIESDAIDKLVEYVGNDLWRMANEIDKLTAYRLQTPEKIGSLSTVVGSHIAVSDIELLVKPMVESNIFDLIDAIGAKNQKKALYELHALLEAGQNELYILSMIVYQFRNLLIVRDFLDRGTTNQYDLAKKAKIHPYVAGKTLAQARSYGLDELKNIYAKLLDFDCAIKTGKMESRTALDLLTVKLCSQNPGNEKLEKS